ncbi:unnamed protein product [Symbiodinium sp. CCMP2592]|nr:unnamed protein product [Symbiodinium sp. CCMP2592]
MAVAPFDYTARNTEITNYFATDTQTTAALNGIRSVSGTVVTNVAAFVVEKSKEVSTQALNLPAVMKQVILFLNGLFGLVDPTTNTLPDDGPNAETVLGLVALFGPITNKGYVAGTLQIKYKTKRFSSQAAVNALKSFFGEPNTAGGTTPLQSLDVSDLIAPQIALLCLFLQGGQTLDQARTSNCLVADTILSQVSEEDIEGFRKSLRNETVLESAVRKNLENRQKIIRAAFVATLAILDCMPENGGNETNYRGPDHLTFEGANVGDALPWERLMETLWTWFDEGRAVGMAICMLRSRVQDRGDASFAEWVHTPITTLAAGLPNSDGLDPSHHPQVFFQWSVEVEEYLFGVYQGERDAPPEEAEEGEAATSSVAPPSGDSVSLMGEPETQIELARHLLGRLDQGDAAMLLAQHETAENLARPRAHDHEGRQLVSQLLAVHLWHYLLFDRTRFGPQLKGNSRVPESFLPRHLLREVSSTHEQMSEYNRMISTCALFTVLRYLMSELAQTLDTAQAVARSAQQGQGDTVDVEVEDDDHLLMQSYMLTDGKGVRLLHLRMLRMGMPRDMAEDGAREWFDQLEALFVAIESDLQGDVAQAETIDVEWLRQWVNEFSAFIPGFTVQTQVESQTTAADAMEADLARLVADEESEREWQEQRAREEAEERDRLAQHECRSLQQDAEAYRQWEMEQVRGAMVRSAEGPSKRRCVLTMEAASGSMDKPRVVHTMALDVPTSGEAVTLTITARMEPDPEDVSTQPVAAPAEERPEQAPIDLSPTLSLPADKTTEDPEGTTNGEMPELEFQEYQHVYQEWRTGKLGLEEVTEKYGSAVAELVQAQFAAQAEDDSIAAIAGMPEACTSPFPPYDGREPSAMVDPDGPLPPFSFFESMYGQWKQGLRTSANIEASFGPQWLTLFERWRKCGLDSIYPILPNILDMSREASGTGMSVSTGSSRRTAMRIPFSVVRQVYHRWQRDLMRDSTVQTIYGAEWLRLFQSLRTEGLAAVWHQMNDKVEWDVDDLLALTPPEDSLEDVVTVQGSGVEQGVPPLPAEAEATCMDDTVGEGAEFDGKCN